MPNPSQPRQADSTGAAPITAANTICNICGVVPEDWLRREFKRRLGPNDKAKYETLGSRGRPMRTSLKRLAEPKSRQGNR